MLKRNIYLIFPSNWYIEKLKNFLLQVCIIPVLVQNEIHQYYKENDVIPYIQSLELLFKVGIHLE